MLYIFSLRDFGMHGLYLKFDKIESEEKVFWFFLLSFLYIS